MVVLFLDSSTIIKYYVAEPGIPWVRTIINSSNNTCVICAISIVEVASALAQLQRNGRYGRPHMRRTFARFSEDIRRGLYLSHSISASTVEFAAELALRHPLKGFDATQVAAAVLTQEMLDAQVSFVSGDKQALSAARLEGLAVDNPFEHVNETSQG